MKPHKPSNKMSTLALALALSCGTVGGLLTVATMIEPAMARGQGGGGGAGGEGAGGSEPAAIMAVNAPSTHARTPSARQPNPPRSSRIAQERCDAQTGGDVAQCKFTQRPTPRIVRINGFANCAVVQQVPSVDGRPTEFYCLRAM